MVKRIAFILLVTAKLSFAQYSLDYFTGKAVENSPALKEYHNLQAVNQVQKQLNMAQNSAYQLSVGNDYLFTPYLNNNGKLFSTEPSRNAVGYDINIFDGGLYSAMLNLERNVFNKKLINTLDRQTRFQDENYSYNFELEKHTVEKLAADQYLNAYQFLLLTRLSQEVIANLNEQLKLTGDLVAKGYAKTQDYLLLKIELQTQDIELNDIEQEYQSNLYQLYALCGIRDKTVVTIEDAAIGMSTVKLQSNFIQKYAMDSLATVIQQELFETKYLPQMKLFVNTGFNAVELYRIQRKLGMSAGFNVSLPIFDGNQKSLTRQQNAITQGIIKDYREYSIRNIDMQRKNLLARIQGLEENIRRLNEQINDYQNLLDMSAQQLLQGNISMIDYLTLLGNFIDLRKNKIDMTIRYQLEINNYNYWNW